MRRRTALGLTAVTVALAGCGGGGSVAAPSGKRLFATDCSHCHSLTGHESPVRQGGDLLEAHFSRAVMLQFAREMPVRRRLTEAELRAVSDYVVAVERGGG